MSDFFVRVFLIYHVVVLVLVRVPVCVWSCARALFCLYIRNLVFYDVSLFFLLSPFARCLNCWGHDDQ